MSYLLIDGRRAGDELGAMMPASVLKSLGRMLHTQGAAHAAGTPPPPPTLAPKLKIAPSAAASAAAQEQARAAVQQQVDAQIAILRNQANADAMRGAGFSGERPASFASGLSVSSARLSPLAIAGAIGAVLILARRRRRR